MDFFTTAPQAVQLMWIGAAVCAVWFGLSVLGRVFDRRTLFGENVWAKPLRFAGSLGLNYATFAVVLSWLSPEWQMATSVVVTAWIALVTLVYQIAYIGVTAALRVPSHFNTSTRLFAVLEAKMAVFAAVVTGPMALLGLLVLVDPGFQHGDAVRYATGIGLIFGTVMTFVTAYHLGIRKGPFFGDKPEAERRMAVTDWSLDRGDLRPAHFFATHLMQAAPLAGWLVALVLAPVPALLAACLFTVGWGWLSVQSYRLALRGLPIQRLWTGPRRYKGGVAAEQV